MGFVIRYSMSMGATSASASVNLQGGFKLVYLTVPTMPSITALDLYGSSDGSNYYQMRNPQTPTATVQINTFIIAATLTSGGAILALPAGLQYYKLVATDSAPTSLINFTVICGNQ